VALQHRLELLESSRFNLALTLALALALPVSGMGGCGLGLGKGHDTGLRGHDSTRRQADIILGEREWPRDRTPCTLPIQEAPKLLLLAMPSHERRVVPRCSHVDSPAIAKGHVLRTRHCADGRSGGAPAVTPT
jgi:hypothetical protein